MNESEFYKGILVELQKLAQVQSIPPRKHSAWPGVAMGALGAGALGLGAYGLYKGLKPIASAVPNPGAGDPEPGRPALQSSSEGPNLFDKAELGGNTAQFTSDTGGTVGDISTAISDAAKVTGEIGSAGSAAGWLNNNIVGRGVSKVSPILGKLKYLKTVGNAASGGAFLAQGLNPNNDSGPYARTAQIGAGTALSGASILKSRIGPAASKILPSATRAPLMGASEALLGDGVKFVPGLGSAYTAGLAGQEAIKATSVAAGNHSQRLNDLGSRIGDSYKGLHEGNPGEQGFNEGVGQMHELVDTPEGQQLTKQVTNPNIFARIGYGWGGTSPNTSALQQAYDKEKSMYEKITHASPEALKWRNDLIASEKAEREAADRQIWNTAVSQAGQYSGLTD